MNTIIFEKPTRLNISRELVKIILSNAIKKCTTYSKQVNKILVDLTMFCLENVVVQNGTSIYSQVNELLPEITTLFQLPILRYII